MEKTMTAHLALQTWAGQFPTRFAHPRRSGLRVPESESAGRLFKGSGCTTRLLANDGFCDNSTRRSVLLCFFGAGIGLEMSNVTRYDLSLVTGEATLASRDWGLG